MQSKHILRRHGAVLQALMMLAAVGLIFWAVNTPAVVGVSAAKRELPVYCVQQDEKIVALSFDAAWGNEDTQALIDILDQYGVSTTFFVVGDWVDKYPESVRALAEAGNEVMNHSSSHAHFSALSTDEITADISACNDKIEAITGVRPTLFAVQWDVDSLDWKGIPAGQITRRVLDRVQPGSIVLFHNAAEHTPEALPAILDALIGEGYRIVPISQILLDGDTFIDSTGRQCRR